MNLQEIRSIAKQYQINQKGLSKGELVHQIQREEGNFTCFATAYDGQCDQVECLWREDCFEAASTAHGLS